ncbi:glycosyltransferase [Candidatus Woesearchaeota archaeon]|nr:glycosyltransferase [Candidatus Woesearchaeota archaeon]
MRVSFLIPAHNEEKIIGSCLDHLATLPYLNYEVLLGLDGCTDGTLAIVKSFTKKYPKIFKYFELNERKGKPAVIDKLVPHATGDIFVIHDADWIFTAGKKEYYKTLFAWFADPHLGGIAESFPLEWNPEHFSSIKSLGHLSVAWSTYFWLEYQKKYFTKRENGILYVDQATMRFPFLVNIFRKELYFLFDTLGDDFERTHHILEKGYTLRIAEDPDYPRMHAAYSVTTFKDIFKIKRRTARAREQVFSKYPSRAGFFSFYLPLFLYMNLHLYQVRPRKVVFGLLYWELLTITSMISHRFTQRKSTKEGWTMRAKRQ